MDAQLEKIIRIIAKEEGVPLKVVRASVQTAVTWTKEQMKAMNHPALYWPRFGTFNLIKRKCPKELKEDYLEYKKNFKKTNNNGEEKETSTKNEIT